MRSVFLRGNAVGLLLLICAPVFAQTSRQKTALTVKGYSGSAPVIQVNGKSYVEVESLARITNGTLSFPANQIVLTIAPSASRTTPVETAQLQPQSPRVSKEFARAAIEVSTAIEDWRTAMVKAVQDNSPVTPDWVNGYRRNAETKLALASSAVVTDPDRDALLLLRAQFANMQSLGDKYLALRKGLSYVAPDALDNDPLNQKVQSCGRGLASLTAGSLLPDLPACH